MACQSAWHVRVPIVSAAVTVSSAVRPPLQRVMKSTGARLAIRVGFWRRTDIREYESYGIRSNRDHG